jgi:polysaccharide export outer membrane protein
MMELPFARLLAAAGFVGLLGMAAAHAEEKTAEYRIGPGDRLELKVVGLPELGQKALVDINGNLPLPLLGAVKVSGLTLAEIQDKIRAALSGKIVYRRAPDGKKIPNIADVDEILVEVAEYRPIYVSGDVPRAGELVYRPGMRVRQALSLAGGQDQLAVRAGGNLVNVFDYGSARNTLMLEFTRERAQYWRLNAELDENGKASSDDLLQRLPQIGGADVIAKSEADLLAIRTRDWQNEKTYLSTAVEQAGNRAKALSAQFETETKGSVADAEEFERTRRLLEKTMTTQNRVTDARRAMLISATRALQIGVQVATAERDQEERARNLTRSVDQRRADLMKQRDESALRLAQLRSRMEANDKKLVFLGGATKQILGDDANKLQITIKRDNLDGVQTIAATEDSLLYPGDVVEVAMKQSLDLGLAAK